MSKGEYYPNFQRYDDELRTCYESDSSGGVDSTEVDWRAHELSFSITQQRWAEILGAIGCMQNAVQNGETITNEALKEIAKEAKEEELFSVPVLMNYGTIRPILVNTFEDTLWNSQPREFVEAEMFDSSESLPVENQIVTFRGIARSRDGSIMLAIDGEGDKLELGVRIDELGLCEPLTIENMRNEMGRAINIDDDIRTLYRALDKLSGTKLSDNDHKMIIESMECSVIPRLKILKFGDQLQVEIPGSLTYENNVALIDKAGSGRVILCGTFEGIGLPEGEKYPIGIELSDVTTIDKTGEEVYLGDREILPISDKLNAKKIAYLAIEQY